MRFGATLAIAILVIPSPPVQGKTIMVSICGAQDRQIYIPVNPRLPGEADDHGCCKKGCHAANDRRKKLNDMVEDCC